MVDSKQFAVIIPVWNRVERLKRAVASVLEQSYYGFELVVIDDGSDRDLSEVQQLVESAGHRWKKQPRAGVSAARNAGVGLSTAPLLAFLDSDDAWHPEKLEKQLEFKNNNPDIKIFQTEELWHRNGVRVNQGRKHDMPEGQAFFRSLKLCCVSASAVVIERELFEQLDGFDTGLAVCEDYDFWLRVAAKNKFGLVREKLVLKWGGSDDQLSKALPAMDRFRIVSIGQLLCASELDTEKEIAAFGELKHKALILHSGAEKRGLALAELYLRIAESAEARDLSRLGEVIAELRETLPAPASIFV